MEPKLQRRKLFVVVTLLILLACSKDRVERGVSYYKNGQLNHEVFLKDGKPEGLGVTYYESGKTLSRTNWKGGKKHGLNTFFYENEKVRQENIYRNGICIISADFTKDGFLEERRIYDSLGRLFDYCNFKEDGSRNFIPGTKRPIFIAESDTVTVGEDYIAEIRLGNRQFDNVQVILGDIEDPKIMQKNPALMKKDSLTSILKVAADSVGLNKVSGIIFEGTAKEDSFDIIPFTHRFYVKPK